MLNIKTGVIPRAQKIVIYGPEGIGKTTLASQFPDPLFIDTEGGTSHMDVRRIDKPGSWTELMSVVTEVSENADICKTLVIDTADWAEQLAITYVCGKYKKNGIEEFGYSKGYVYLAEEWGRLLAQLENVIAAGIHVVVTAHAKMRKFEQPDELGAYDRWETKLTKQVAPLLKEWCDMLLFCNYKTFLVRPDNVMEKAKAQGGKRVMYSSHHPCWDAKNRHGLPEELPLSFDSIAHLFADKPAAAERPIDTLRDMMAAADVSETELRQVVVAKGYPDTPITEYDDNFITGWIIRYWPKILDMISTNNEEGVVYDG